MPSSASLSKAEIFAAHRVLVEDPELLAASNTLIAAGKSVVFAWQAIETQCRILVAAQQVPCSPGGASDLRDIERCVLRKLTGDDGLAPVIARDAVWCLPTICCPQTSPRWNKP